MGNIILQNVKPNGSADLSKISMLGECLTEGKTSHRARATLYQFLSDRVSVIYCQVTNHSKNLVAKSRNRL